MKLSRLSAAFAALILHTAAAKNTKLRGGDDSEPSSIVTQGGEMEEGDCTIIAADNLMIPEGHEGYVEQHRRLSGNHHLEFACQFSDGSVASMDTLTPEQQDELEEAMSNGKVKSGRSNLNLDDLGATVSGSSVSIPKGANIAASAKGGNPPSHAKGGGSANSAKSTTRRHLAQLVGNKYTLVVKGVFNDYLFSGKSAAQLSDDVFGTANDPVNLKSQLEACSFGKLVTIPGPDPTWNGGAFTSLAGIEAADGVLEINMGVDMTGMSKADIYNLFVTKTIEALGPEVTALPGPFDHVIFARETCLTECGWAACKLFIYFHFMFAVTSYHLTSYAHYTFLS